eukprot:GFUD01115140.1.p1 GENE.GFUD01115140.1~~GFUD01115140.1.p1  ORF type:complete len:357 (-),score=52.61 GFUD01115140.1:238-1206(-)
MVQIDTDTWQYTFLMVTLASVVFININAAIFQGGILGVAGKFPPAYMGAVFSGQAIGGIFASGTNVIFLACGASEVLSGFFCFVLSVVFLFTALIAYGVVTRSEFYQHYLGEEGSSDSEKKPEDSKLLDNKATGPSVPIKVNPGRVLLLGHTRLLPRHQHAGPVHPAQGLRLVLYLLCPCRLLPPVQRRRLYRQVPGWHDPVAQTWQGWRVHHSLPRHRQVCFHPPLPVLQHQTCRQGPLNGVIRERCCLHYHHVALQYLQWIHWLHLHDLWSPGGQVGGGSDCGQLDGRPPGVGSGYGGLPLKFLCEAHLERIEHSESIFL